MTKMSTGNRKRGLRSSVEALERRRLYSVAVSQGYPGYYEIDGDNGANSIAVSVDQNAGTFTLDGQTYRGVSYITINGYGGNDNIQVSGSPGAIGCTITDGDGNDTLSLNFDGALYAGNGQDTFYLRDSFEGEVHTGSGNDKVFVSGACVDPVIYAGDGNNLIDASQNLYGVTIYGGNGNNTIYGTQYDDTVFTGTGSNTIYCLNGNDTIYQTGGQYDIVNAGSAVYSLYYY